MSCNSQLQLGFGFFPGCSAHFWGAPGTLTTETSVLQLDSQQWGLTLASSWINRFQHKPPPVLHQDALSKDGLKFQQLPRLPVQVRAGKAPPPHGKGPYLPGTTYPGTAQQRPTRGAPNYPAPAPADPAWDGKGGSSSTMARRAPRRRARRHLLKIEILLPATLLSRASNPTKSSPEEPGTNSLVLLQPHQSHVKGIVSDLSKKIL